MALSIQNRSVASTPASLPLPSTAPSTTPSASTRRASHFQKDAFVAGNSSRAQQLLGAPQTAAPVSLAANGLTVPQVELDFGSSGPEVFNLQKCLVALGFMGQDQMNSGPGNFGFITQQAVTDFQSSNGIQPVNGRFGPLTRTTMEREVARLGGTPPAGNFNSMVNDLYRQVFKRAADPGGMATWTQKAQEMRNQGASDSQIRSALHSELSNSLEGQAISMVEQAFSDFLGRTNSGRSWWHDEAMHRLNNGESFEAVRDNVRWSIRTSDEFYLKNPQQLVHDIYQGELGRQADPEGMRTHMNTYNTLRAQGRSIDEIRNSMINAVRASPEWMDRQQVPGAEQAIRYATNPPPNPMNQPSGDWHYWCLGLVNMAYQSAGRSIPNLQVNKAIDAYHLYAQQGKIHNDGSPPPRGALVFYDSFGAFGHIGISLGNGRIMNTLESGPPSGERGLHDLPNYLGWALP
jgi:peptidoglycan hydrolase-like protein with peptidoglycan-binding domain